ncbi:MAG: hypothetical protein HIU57_08610 [Acidobacteria bacterium]|nr:hypothetical protein [Acidobacteriota bacterium]
MTTPVTPNPPLSHDEVTAVVIAVTLLTASRRAPAPVVVDVTPPWRFSGRHFGSTRRCD